ncbi:MAG: hypothetical protein JW716_03625 [Candidatus Aenigmarchaeota archaeon]|nr:hypothetical protein [Candidatus Aenigmarchaeota archaeon]
MRFLKGQSAMEYLMTYGWAIVIVIIVAAALVALGFFDVPTPEAATGFELGAPAAGSWNLDASDGSFAFRMTSSKSYNVRITGITVENAAGTDCTVPLVNGVDPATTPVSVATGQTIAVTANCSVLGLGAGSKYNLNIAFDYDNVDGDFTGLSDSGTVSGTASE